MEEIVDEYTARKFIETWLAEDVSGFDFSLFGLKKSQTDAKFFFKSKGVCAGFPFVTILFKVLNCEISWDVKEGAEILFPQTIGTVKGPTRQILRGERLALNILCRASGIATLARSMTTSLREHGWSGRLAGTRKTTPGFRIVEKYAMMVGGADCHRYNLSSMVMLKDNHLYCSEDVTELVARTRKVCGFSLKIEVECSSLETALKAAAGGADIIMFDNPTSVESLQKMSTKLKSKYPHILVEVSGGITSSTINNFAISTVDIISTSSLCQGYPVCDISLKTVDNVDGRLTSSSKSLNHVLNNMNNSTAASLSHSTNLQNEHHSGPVVTSVRSVPPGGPTVHDENASSPSSVDVDVENERLAQMDEINRKRSRGNGSSSNLSTSPISNQFSMMSASSDTSTNVSTPVLPTSSVSTNMNHVKRPASSSAHSETIPSSSIDSSPIKRTKREDSVVNVSQTSSLSLTPSTYGTGVSSLSSSSGLLTTPNKPDVPSVSVSNSYPTSSSGTHVLLGQGSSYFQKVSLGSPASVPRRHLLNNAPSGSSSSQASAKVKESTVKGMANSQNNRINKDGRSMMLRAPLLNPNETSMDSATSSNPIYPPLPSHTSTNPMMSHQNSKTPLISSLPEMAHQQNISSAPPMSNATADHFASMYRMSAGFQMQSPIYNLNGGLLPPPVSNNTKFPSMQPRISSVSGASTSSATSTQMRRGSFH